MKHSMTPEQVREWMQGLEEFSRKLLQEASALHALAEKWLAQMDEAAEL